MYALFYYVRFLPFFQGESDPIPLDVHCTHEQQILSRNMAFGHATFVIRGSGKAVVTRTGINTIMGETADLTAANAKADTLITRYCRLLGGKY